MALPLEFGLISVKLPKAEKFGLIAKKIVLFCVRIFFNNISFYFHRRSSRVRCLPAER